MKDGDGHGRDEDREVQSEGADQEQHEQDDLEIRPSHDIAETFDEAATGRDGAVTRLQFIGAQQPQGAEHSNKGEGIDQKHPSGADTGDQTAGERRADHSGGMERRRVQRHRIRKIGLIDQFGDEGLPGRRIECGCASQQKRENVDVPQLDQFRSRRGVQDRAPTSPSRPACKTAPFGGRDDPRRNPSAAAAGFVGRTAAPS